MGFGRGGGLVGVALRKKMRSVFGTCMVSGIRRREKVRERDRGSSRGEVVVMDGAAERGGVGVM